jgi:hypothetical protein
MSVLFRRGGALLILAILPMGCVNPGAVSPGASVDQLQAHMGPPTTVWKNADGSEVWEYPQGPLGTQTFMVTMGPEHAVRDVRQVLTEDNFKNVRAGMSREDVRRLLGRQMDVRYFDFSGEEVWSWRYVEWKVRPAFFNVHFDRESGAVKYVSRTEEAKGGKKH